MKCGKATKKLEGRSLAVAATFKSSSRCFGCFRYLHNSLKFLADFLITYATFPICITDQNYSFLKGTELWQWNLESRS